MVHLHVPLKNLKSQVYIFKTLKMKDTEHINILTLVCTVKARWDQVNSCVIFNLNVPPNTYYADVIGTTQIIRYIWSNIFHMNRFFKDANIYVEDLLNNPFISYTLIKWPHQLASIPHILRIWEHVAYKGFSIKYNHLKWFNATLQYICKDIIAGTKVFEPHDSYRPYHDNFGDDTINDMSLWKYWLIKEYRAPSRARAPPPPASKQMKKKFKNLLKYKLCDASEQVKVDLYEQLIKTIE